MKENKTFVIIIGAVLVASIALIAWASKNKQNSASTGNSTNPTELAAIVSDDYTIGPATAPVTLIEYLDFECEACGAYFPLVKQLEADYPNELRVVKRYFPLPGHKNGMPAALAVEAAARQGKFNEMHDLLFTEQKNWGEKAAATPAVFEAYAAQLGLNMDQYKKDVASPEVKSRVERDMASGRALGARGTPTFVLNGVRIENPQGIDAFKALIEQAAKGTEQ